MGYRYSTLPAHPVYPHPGYTPPLRTLTPGLVTVPRAVYSGQLMAVGLISVGQLSLYTLFSGFRTMTEVYNLVEIHRINNHLSIPGTK